MLELSAAQSCTSWTAPYFRIDFISSENKSCLLFKSQLKIKAIHYNGKRYDMKPLSLYESILNGDIIRIQDISQNNIVKLNEKYPNIPRMLQYLEEKHRIIYVNDVARSKQIQNTELKNKLDILHKDTDKTKRKEAEQFVWKPTVIEMRQFITKERDYIATTIKTAVGSRFYCEMSTKEHKSKLYGVISLTALRLASKQNQATISFQIYCEEMNDFYIKYDDVIIKMDQDVNNAKKIIYYEWKELYETIQNKNFIEWKIVLIYKDIKQVNIEKEKKDDKNKIMEITQKLESKAIQLKDELSKNSELKYLPLHQMNANHISDMIQCWILNDIRFKENVQEIMSIFADCSLSGERIISFSINNIQRILEEELLEFMEIDTFNIMMRKIKYWKTVDDEKSAEEIAYELYCYPMYRLLERVREKIDMIHGQKYIEYYQQNDPWIKNMTGWNETEIYQLYAVLFKYAAYSASETKKRTQEILSKRMEKAEAKLIEERILNHKDIELETINYKIKRGMNDLEAFSDKVMETVSNIANEKKDVTDEWLKNIYHAIAECLVTNDPDTKLADAPSKYKLDSNQAWICFNCSNYNFSNTINGKINMDLSICTLCGIKQRDAVIMILKQCDTYTMVNDVNDNELSTVTETENKELCDVDKAIESAMNDQDFNLCCASCDDKDTKCSSIMRLAKQLIIYKKWLSTKGNVVSTTQVDIDKYINDDEFHDICIKSLHSIKKIAADKDATDVIAKLLNDNQVMNKSVFLSFVRKQFVVMLIKSTKIKKGSAGRLYTTILNALKNKAQIEEYGALFLIFRYEIIEKDYHHILEAHIKNGDKTTAENASRFFKRVIHYDDKSVDIKQCKSVNRMSETQILDEDISNNKEAKDQMTEDKDIWSSNQYYIQTQLDIIHTFLVHSSWEYYVKRYVEVQHNEDNIDEEDAKISEDEWSTSSMLQNKHKFMSELQETKLKNNYGFGVDHQHPYLEPIHFCMRNELLFNTLQAITVTMFRELMTKALKKHHIAVNEDPHRTELVCTYYKKEYNLIRNQPIGIRHILALIIYTDLSKFCTAFRETYRRINNESDDEIIKRHQEIYFCARNLYEAIEFFGQRMKARHKVYHGLNQMMNFQRFTAFFSQPMSTTTDIRIGYKFAEGSGILLILKSGLKDNHLNVSEVPKYIKVAWLSRYPQEKEWLFYGNNVYFEIHDIIEVSRKRRHREDLLALNQFQNIMHNYRVNWDKSEKCKKMIQALDIFIKSQIKINYLNDDQKNRNETNYAQSLFGYFCNHPHTTSIGINNYYSLPKDIRSVLIFEEEEEEKGNDSKQKKSKPKMTFNHLVNLFKYLTEIKLNNLKISQMEQDKESYIDAVLKYCKSDNARLRLIIFQSEPQQDRKGNTALELLAKKNMNKFSKYQWNIFYKFDLTNTLTHCLTFVNENKIFIHPKKALFVKHVANVHECKWMNHVSYFMQVISIKTDYICIQLTANEVNNKNDRRFRLQQRDNASKTIVVDQMIVIPKTEAIATTNIAINKTSPKSYDLALFNAKNTDDRIQDSNQLKFQLLQKKDDFPPNNTNYKPHAIDISSIFAIKDGNNHAYIYWSTPSFLFGDISYKVVHDSDDLKENEINIIKALPYRIPLSQVPSLFKIITQTTVYDKCYESDATETIVVDPMNHAAIKSWDEYSNMLQILSIDADEIQIKFSMKELIKRRIKCIIQCIDGNDQKSSQKFTVHTGRAATKDIEVKPGTMYTFVIFLDGNQISNIVSVQTPENDFDPNNGYIPSSPNVESIRKYYDETKEHILVVWDLPHLVFGDMIIYQVKYSNDSPLDEVIVLPLEISTINVTGVEIQIRTISIIDGERFEGKWSKSVTIVDL